MIRLAVNELRRVTAGRLPKLAVFALVLVPLLYGSLYLYANHDPYQRLDKVPAALVVADTGATDSGGTRTDAGREVADKLHQSGAFDWHEVDASEADQGVRDGRYTFSLTLPPDFSAALLSSGQFTPRQGLITVTTNDANNYLVGTIAERVTTEVRGSVASQIGTEAADRFLLGFATIHDKISQAADGAHQLADGLTTAHDGAVRLADGQHQLLDGATALATGAGQAASGASTLSGGLNTLRDKTKDLPAQTALLADGARQVADGDEQIAQTGERIAGVSQDFVSHLDQFDADVADRLRAAGLPEDQVAQVLDTLHQLRTPVDSANGTVQQVSGQLRTLADGAHQVADGAGRLAAATPALTSGIGQAAGGAKQLAAGTAQLRDGSARLRDGERTAVGGADQLATGLTQLSDGAVRLRDGLDSGLGQIPDPDQATRDATAKTIGDPVAVRDVGNVKASSYGAGLAPFFLSLSTWIGAFVLFLLLRPLSSRALAAGRAALPTALAGWLPAAVLGLAQVVLLYTVVTTLVGIHPARPIATLAFLGFTTLTFTAVLHGLNAFFGAIGKFLGLVILITQLISAGGTFPWQTLPAPLWPVHRVLPMSYTVDALRHLLYGGGLSTLPLDLGVLAAWLVGGLALSTLAASRMRVWTPSRLAPELVL